MKFFAGLRSAFSHRRPPVTSRGGHSRTAGNIFFALFAAVAMVGAVGYGFNSVIRGPISGMTEVTRKTVAESTVITASRLAIVGATTQQTLSGDCDADGYVEPMPYRDAGAGLHPAGGGWLPAGMMSNTLDPWNTEYGYCAWDAGPQSVANAVPACGGATPRRLQGSPNGTQYAIAIISAGKDRKFQTTCNPYADTAPVDGKPDVALVVKPGTSDDIVLGYSYAEANDLGNNMWKIKNADPGTVQSGMNLDVGGGANFSEGVVLSGNTTTGGGLILPADTGNNMVTGPCDAVNDKQIRRNVGVQPPVIEICDFTGGLGWNPLAGGAISGGGATTGSLVGHWKLDETSGTTAMDSSSSGLNGTLINAPVWQPTGGAYGGALSYLWASDQQVKIPRSATIESSAITVAAWVKRSGTPPAGTSFVTKTWGEGAAPTYMSYALQMHGTNLTPLFLLGKAGGQSGIEGTTIIPDGTWTHIVGVYDPNGPAPQKRLYINGVLDASENDTSPLVYNTTNGDLYLGVDRSTSGARLQGALDDVRIYNYGLSDAQIEELYQNTQPANVNMISPRRKGTLYALWDYRPFPSQTPGENSIVALDDGGPCAIKENGKAYCWGNDGWGQLGDGPDNNDKWYLSEVLVPGGVYKISAKNGKACAIDYSGQLWCWGVASDNWGLSALGYASSNAFEDTPKPVDTPYKDFIDVSVGQGHACAVRKNGEAWCWGNGWNGELGNGANTSSTTPVKVSNVNDFVQISASLEYAASVCGVTRRGVAYCWGGEVSGEFGNGAAGSSNVPSQVLNITDFVMVKRGYQHTCGLRAGGEIWCWGDDTDGKLGNGAGVTSSQIPVKVAGHSDFVKVSSGFWGSCAVKRNGEAYCWGSDAYDSLANGGDDNNPRFVPERVKTIANVIDIIPGVMLVESPKMQTNISNDGARLSVGKGDACYIAKDGSMSCWGADGGGQLGNGALGASDSPSPVADSGPWVQVDNGEQEWWGVNNVTNCGIKADGTMWCWGNDDNGVVGNGAAGATTVPVQIGAADGPWSRVSVGWDHACALKVDGTAWCWGSDNDNKLGVAGSGNKDVPTQIQDSGPWKNISAGANFTCGVKRDGTGWCWGNNDNGQLGDGKGYGLGTGPKADPTQISDPGPWSVIEVGGVGSCGIKTDGSGWCWGSYASAALYPDDGLIEQVPIIEPGPWASIMPGHTHTCAVKVDGSAWCWGLNDYGQLGLGPSWTLAQVKGGSTWKTVKAGIDFSCGIKADDSVWCWGADWDGQLGNGPGITANQDVPSKVKIAPRHTGWRWNDAGTGLSPLPGLNLTIGTTRYISDTGFSNRGFQLLGTGRARMLHNTNSQFTIESNGTGFSPQITMRAAGAMSSSSDVTSGLVGKWSLDEGTGSTVTNSGGGNNGTTAGGPTWLAAAKINAGMTFDGVDDRVRIPRYAALETGVVTVGFWMRRNGAQNDYATMIQKTYNDNGGPEERSWAFYFDGTSDDAIVWSTGYTGGYDELYVPVTLADNTWYYVVGVYDPAGAAPQKKVYINGALAASSTLTAPMPFDTSSNGDLHLASAASYAAGSYAGALDEVRVYNRALSDAEISQIYALTASGVQGRSMGVDYATGNFEIARNPGTTTSALTSLNPDLEITGNGYVGIGTNGWAAAKLDVKGAVKIGNDAGGCTAGKQGTIRWNGTTFEYCDTSWKAMGSAGTLWERGENGFSPGDTHSCAIKPGGDLWCWGVKTYGALGDNTSTGQVNSPIAVHSSSSSTGWTDWTYIEANKNYPEQSSCGVRANGTAWCWGFNSAGQLGNNSTTTALRPTQVHSDVSATGWSDWKSITVGWDQACGIRRNGTAWCWGWQDSGRIGNNVISTGSVLRPVQVHSDASATGWSDWIQIATYGETTCGVRANGTAWCWGSGYLGACGDNQGAADRPRPVQVHSDVSATGWSDWKMVATGEAHNCGVRKNGTAWCWGDAANGKLGNNTTTPERMRPTQVHSDASSTGWSDWVSISAGRYHTCGLRANGTAWCWGYNVAGELGDNSTTQRTRPVQVHSSTSSTGWSDWVSIKVGESMSCGTRANGTMWCWGRAASGRLGDGQDTTNRLRPVQVN